MLFSNYDYDIIIMGGGISGLFMAYKLLDTDLKVILIEGNHSLGGRVQTIQKENLTFEMGAARFHHSHGKVISLINDLKLNHQIFKLPDEIDHILRGNLINHQYSTKNKLQLETLLKESYEKKNQFKIKELETITFFQYLILIYDYETAVFIKDAFGYDSEFIHLNALAALEMFENDFLKDNYYYVLQNGLSQLIEMMEKK